MQLALPGLPALLEPRAIRERRARRALPARKAKGVNVATLVPRERTGCRDCRASKGLRENLAHPDPLAPRDSPVKSASQESRAMQDKPVFPENTVKPGSLESREKRATKVSEGWMDFLENSVPREKLARVVGVALMVKRATEGSWGLPV